MENPKEVKIKNNFTSILEEVNKFTQHIFLNKGEDTSSKEVKKITKEFEGFVEKIIKTKTELEQHAIDEPNDSSQIAALAKALDPIIAFEKKYTDTYTNYFLRSDDDMVPKDSDSRKKFILEVQKQRSALNKIIAQLEVLQREKKKKDIKEEKRKIKEQQEKEDIEQRIKEEKEQKIKEERERQIKEEKAIELKAQQIRAKKKQEEQQKLRSTFEEILIDIEDNYSDDIKSFKKGTLKDYNRFLKVEDSRPITQSMVESLQSLFKTIKATYSRKDPIEVIEKDFDDSLPIKIIHESSKLKTFIEKDPAIMGTITNIQTYGWGGSIGTSQRQKVGGYRVKHQHIRGDDAIAFRWDDKQTLHIVGYGTKSDSALNGSGGYLWDTKPK